MNLRVPSDAGSAPATTRSTTARRRTAGGGGLDWATFLLGDVTQSEPIRQHLAWSPRRSASIACSTTGRTPGAVTPKAHAELRAALGGVLPRVRQRRRTRADSPISVQGLDRVAGDMAAIGLNGNIANDLARLFRAATSGFAYQVNRERPSCAWGMGAAYDMGVFGSELRAHRDPDASRACRPAGRQGAEPGECRRLPSRKGLRLLLSRRFRQAALLPVAGPSLLSEGGAPIRSAGNNDPVVRTAAHPSHHSSALPDARCLERDGATPDQPTPPAIEVAYIGNKGHARVRGRWARRTT